MKTPISKWKIVVLSLTAALLLLGIIIFSMKIQNIKVTGTTQYTEEQIENMLFDTPLSSNMVYAYVRDKFQKHQQIPFVEDYKMVFQGWNSVEIIIYEKSVVGYVTYMGSNMYFDKDGIIVESTSMKLDGIPWITGLQFGHIVLHKPLPIESKAVFDEILNLTQVLSTYQMSVDKIRYDSHNNAVLYMGDIMVVLGDSSNINGKISELNDQLPVLDGRKGTLYLDTYDETKTDMWYSFIQS